MIMSEVEQINYLGNLIFLANLDGSISPKEMGALEEIRSAIGAKKSTLQTAMKFARSGTYSLTVLETFVANVSNVADLIYVFVIEGACPELDKQLISDFAEQIGLTSEQLTLLAADVIKKIEGIKSTLVCHSCSAAVNGDSKYCPKCGTPLDLATSTSDYRIPETGIVIEFCESTAAGFNAALDIAQRAPVFLTGLQNKKTWYLAAWADDALADATELARRLGGIRNRRCYRNGIEIQWNELFGFLYCVDGRDKAYRPIEYCFGKDENRLNPWGCKQARMDWTDWAQWFSYGHFEKGSFLDRGGYFWVFDKHRIRHEVMTNLHKVRFCPHLRMQLINSVLDALPEKVLVARDKAWGYAHATDDAPGAIKVVEIEKSYGTEFKHEYYADGIRPVGLAALESILHKAFADAGVTDTTAAKLVR